MPRPALARLGWSAEREAQVADLGGGLTPGRIIRVDRGQALAQTETMVVRCSQGTREAAATVGDWVALEQLPGAEFLRIANILPRTSALERSGWEGVSSQAIAANVDHVLIVHSTDRLNFRRLERELAQVLASSAVPVIVLSKSDLTLSLGELVKEAERVGRGVPVLTVSSLLGDGLANIQSLFSGNSTGALIGPSGAGKSTLANSLLGREVMPTGEVRASDHRGRHTTAARHLLALPGGGALIDTPGMREFGMSGDGLAVDNVFGDITAEASNCRFNDCNHSGEPGCGVAEAVVDGRIDDDRLASYHKLEREVAAWRARNDPLLRKQRAQIWKNRTKGMRQRKKLGDKLD